MDHFRRLLHTSTLGTREVLKYIVVPSILISPLIVHFYHQRRVIQGDKPHEAIQHRECRYRLDTSTSAVFKLPDGRKLGYAQYGRSEARVVFAFHGLPGSRLECAAWEDVALRLNARLIAVDRPGIGWSSPQPERRILDHAKDVELLAEHLGLKEWLVMGASGGGPYALACAYSHPPDKLKGVSVKCGIGPPDMSRHGMALPNWIGWTFLWRRASWFVRWWFGRDPCSQLYLDDNTRYDLTQQQFASEKLHEKDLEWSRDTEFQQDVIRLYLRSCRETFSQGLYGFELDGHLLASPWGFRLEDIRRDLPIQLWYGKYDVLVPPGHGQESALRLGPNADLRMLEETHSSLIINHKEKMLEALLACT